MFSGDGEHLDVFADDAARTGKRGLLVEGALEAHQLLVLVVAVDGDLRGQFAETGITVPWGHGPMVALGGLLVHLGPSDDGHLHDDF